MKGGRKGGWGMVFRDICDISRVFGVMIDSQQLAQI